MMMMMKMLATWVGTTSILNMNMNMMFKMLANLSALQKDDVQKKLKMMMMFKMLANLGGPCSRTGFTSTTRYLSSTRQHSRTLN